MKRKMRIATLAILIALGSLAVSCATAPPPAPPEITRTVGQYQVTTCGSIIDTATRLEWFVGPDQRFDQPNIKRWIRELQQCSGPCCDRKWRLPSRAEMATLYRAENRNGREVRVVDPQFRELAGGELWLLWDREALVPDPLFDLATVPLGVNVDVVGDAGEVRAQSGGLDLSGAVVQYRRPVAVRPQIASQ